MEGQPDPLFVSVFVALLLIAGSAIKKIFTPTLYEDEPEEEYDVTTTAVYDNAGADELLKAKMRVLELAIENHRPHIVSDAGPSAEAIAKTARIWWDFIALKPDDESDE
jgi:hypothetical protein